MGGKRCRKACKHRFGLAFDREPDAEHEKDPGQEADEKVGPPGAGEARDEKRLDRERDEDDRGGVCRPLPHGRAGFRRTISQLRRAAMPTQIK